MLTARKDWTALTFPDGGFSEDENDGFNGYQNCKVGLSKSGLPPLTPEQKDELDRRYAEHLRNPGSALGWEDVKARLLARYK